MLTFDKNCSLLKGSNTGIYELDFDIAFSLVDFYKQSIEEIFFCSLCSYTQFPQLNEYVSNLMEKEKKKARVIEFVKRQQIKKALLRGEKSSFKTILILKHLKKLQAKS